MIKPLELFIGLRYTRAKRRNHFISFISLTSMLGITIGVWALITVLSVMNGFERELRERILGVTSHVTVSEAGGGLTDWQQTMRQISSHPRIQQQAPYIVGQGMLTKGKSVNGAIIRGILPDYERKVSQLANKMKAGKMENLEDRKYGIVLGQELAWQLGLTMGSKVTVVAPRGQITPAGLLPRLRRFTVVGIFKVGMYEYDSGLALIHIGDAARLLRTEGKVTGLRLKLDDVYQARKVSGELKAQLGGRFNIGNWTREHANFFRALKIEKRVMFIILLLIVAVAAFNIISTLVMMVTDKQADIAILRTLGLSPGSIMKVFMVQGTAIGIIGTILGGVVGVVTALNVETLVPAIESFLNTKFFPADVYIISDFPAELRWPDVIKITLASFVMSIFATLYPAWRASRIQPAEALRYE